MIVEREPYLEREAFPEPYRYVKEGVDPGENAVVFYLTIPRGSVGFISKVAIDVYSDTYVEFRIDGRLVENTRRTVLEVESFTPETYDPPLVVEKWVKFTFFNNSTATVYPGVLCNGEIVKRAS
jgi:hypothetical protein